MSLDVNGGAADAQTHIDSPTMSGLVYQGNGSLGLICFIIKHSHFCYDGNNRNTYFSSPSILKYTLIFPLTIKEKVLKVCVCVCGGGALTFGRVVHEEALKQLVLDGDLLCRVVGQDVLVAHVVQT